MHRFDLRVYYEDTDLAGIVYYANYLKFIERGRSEWLRALGFDQRALKEETDTVFAVRRLEADYIAPAKFDDALTVLSTAEAVTPARLVLAQQVLRGEERLFEAKVTLVALNAAGGPTRLPKPLRDAFAALV
ncbi:tol-pal system-associated acyl-CoA thioesterase [Falsigemmobacter intermedius]|uniref:Tol-pal system-associated acyl-CoA thioesterase n=1 Tax=Falsigemmobacter intermedius TaxID=1553448 RepID=A0A444MEE5_9RHOB|nr:tol-pal system-associated acyl-CoA thioesterase [Falsigemmobacter intermedius]RWY43266.1 tol-pal system-associated acyl-CoA thioesterase [Falsigemmobacter intermedius]